MNKSQKTIISNSIKELPVGFIYWITENKGCRGLEETKIEDMSNNIDLLLYEYKSKYPNGLTGFR